MSLYDYQQSKKVSLDDPPFASLIMAALRKADTNNAEMLCGCWPEICDELKVRYNAPGGILPTDPEIQSTHD